MSGGVDSSVTAALLKKRGYDVIGMTMQLLEQETEHQSACCNLDTITLAKRVCDKLDIPHYTINARETFQKNVISNFVSEYLEGRTPNPCVSCNRHIKFDVLWEKGLEIGADYVATGHYCKRTYSPTKQRYYLKKGRDPRKDQSYFLYMLNNSQLKRILFPLGNYHKSEIRALAHKFGLVNANKPESQEICFVTSKSYKSFIEKYAPKDSLKEGPIVNSKGDIIGQHKGLYQYTIGQRRGLNIPSQTPLFVTHIDIKTNTLVVGQPEDVQTSHMTLSSFSLVNKPDLTIGKAYDIKVRYQMTPFKAIVKAHQSNQATLEAFIPQTNLTRGQSAVLFENDKVIGGGIIEN